ncbi:MAG: GGDEF domain-containing protein [Lachnospiraceae bacterium]|nr:GGDEF domain-containing protein [Lachnospiraceae bacterium]
MYHSKKIGVFISHISGEFQCDICQGIIDKASEFGYFVEFYSSTDGENIGNYGIGEKSILRIPNFDDFSGVIFVSGTYLSEDLRDRIAKALQSKCTCPIIDINQNHSFAPSVALDNDSATGQITEHLIGTHHYRRICYLGNSSEPLFSHKRQEAYEKVMALHNLPVNDTDLYECSYEEKDIAAALTHFLSVGKPDAIVCYNDRMALTLLSELLDHGYRVPEDIAITGTDMLEEGQAMNPSLTSVTFPIKELGIAAAEQLLLAIRGEKPEDIFVIKASPHIGGSCGCPSTYARNPFYFQHSVNQKVCQMENAIMDNIHMSSSLQSVIDLNEGMDLLERFLPQSDGFRDLYLCLYPDWDSVSTHIRTITASEDEDMPDHDIILLKFAFKDGRRLHECSFTKQSTLPDHLFDTDASAYIFSPLYFGEKEFGYVAMAYKGKQMSYQLDFFSWLMNVSSMLRNIAENKRTGLLVSRLEEIYMRDELTGLYNRHGYNLLSEELLEKKKNSDTPIAAFVFDLDCLKEINDTYGHSEGDFAIQILGQALESAVRKGDICARLGGDEFYLLAADYTNEDAHALLYQVNRYLENYNKLHAKAYRLSVSSGFALETMSASFDLPKLFKRADQEMYLDKKKKPNRHC